MMSSMRLPYHTIAVLTAPLTILDKLFVISYSRFPDSSHHSPDKMPSTANCLSLLVSSFPSSTVMFVGLEITRLPDEPGNICPSMRKQGFPLNCAPNAIRLRPP